jgi:CRP-like cAMP-binding protein
MNLNEEVELLKGVPILSKIEPAKLKLLAFTSERVNYAEGQELCHQGDPGDAMYVILGGVADVLIDKAGTDGQIAVAEMKKTSSACARSAAS